MKVLVTGREGQIARSLLERGAQVPALELIALGRPQIDLERPEQLSQPIRALSPDVIINAAAYTAVDQAEDEPDRARIVNARRRAIAAAARDCGARIIQISTRHVFDGTAAGAYREDAPTNPSASMGGQVRRRREGQGRGAGPSHPPHRLGLQPVRQEFRPDDDGPRERPRHGFGRGRSAWHPTSGARSRNGLIRVLEACAAATRAGRHLPPRWNRRYELYVLPRRYRLSAARRPAVTRVEPIRHRRLADARPASAQLGAR